MPNGLLRACFCRVAVTGLAVASAVALMGCNDSSNGGSSSVASTSIVTTVSPNTGDTASDVASPGTILTAGAGDPSAVLARKAASITTSQTSPEATMLSDGTHDALLSWTPPMQNTDGTALQDLAGYRVYFGQDPDNLTDAADLLWGGYLWVQFAGLDPGDWYFSIRSYNSEGIESDFAPMVSKQVV